MVHNPEEDKFILYWYVWQTNSSRPFYLSITLSLFSSSFFFFFSVVGANREIAVDIARA